MQDLTFWLVAYSGSNSYIGRLVPADHELAKLCGSTIKLSPVLLLIDQHMTMMDERTHQPVIRHNVTALPLGVSLAWEQSHLYVKPTAVQLLTELPKEDQEAYQELIARGEQIVLQQRAVRSGITIAGNNRLV
jgi:hypothetical protein